MQGHQKAAASKLRETSGEANLADTWRLDFWPPESVGKLISIIVLCDT